VLNMRVVSGFGGKVLIDIGTPQLSGAHLVRRTVCKVAIDQRLIATARGGREGTEVVERGARETDVNGHFGLVGDLEVWGAFHGE